MKFHEHIIRVTVPGLPCEVTREELSGELADFAHRPEHFLEEVTKSEVVSPERRGSEPGSIAFERNIYFSMQIEEPEPGQLFIRFIYFEDRPEVPTAIEMNSREQQVDYLRRLAYESKDQSIVAQMLTDIVERKMALKN